MKIISIELVKEVLTQLADEEVSTYRQKRIEEARDLLESLGEEESVPPPKVKLPRQYDDGKSWSYDNEYYSTSTAFLTAYTSYIPPEALEEYKKFRIYKSSHSERP